MDTPVLEREAPKKKPGSGKKKKWIVLLIIVVVVLAAAAIVFFKLHSGGGKSKTEVVTDVVSYGSISSKVEGSGMTKAKESKSISLSSVGTVLEVYVTEGDTVTAGQPLFRVDSPAARTAVQNAQNNVNGYQKQINAIQKELAAENLTAPHGGKLMECADLKVGDEISKGEQIATLADDTKLRLSQYYSYAYAGEIKAGQAASVSIPALMTTVSGTVEKVHMVERITPEGSKLFKADIVLNNPGTLTADMLASATIGSIYPYESGKLEFYQKTELTAGTSGAITSVQILDYQKVSAGQTLVHIDTEDVENELFSLRQSLETAQKDLETAQEDLDNMNAVAPIDGVVMGLSIAAGDELTGSSTTAITIANTNTILIDATVDEWNISYVKPGMMVDLDQWGNYFSGVVDSVSLNSTVTNGVASFPMVISVDNSDGAMQTGGNVTYTLVASQNDNCLVLPLQCVKSVTLDDGEVANVVFVAGDRPENAVDLTAVPDGIPEGYWAVPVEIGIADNYNVEIRSGVEEGTEVFTQILTESSWG